MARSISDVSAKVTADASQFVSEFRRADNEARRSSARIDAEVDKLTRSIKKKFSAGGIGQSVLSGLGLGSGFAVAQKAAEMLVKPWEQAAEAARTMAEYSDRATAALEQQLRLRRSDAQQLELILQKEAALAKQAASGKRPDFPNMFSATLGIFGLIPNPANVEAERIKAEQQILAGEKDRLQRSIGMEQTNAWIDALTEQMKAQVAAAKADAREATGLQINLSEAIKATNAAMEQQDAETEKMAENFRQMISPSREFMQQIEQVNSLLAAQKLTADEAAAAIERLRSAAVDAELKAFFSDIDETSKSTFRSMTDAERLWAEETMRIVGNSADNMAGAWVDALNGVEGAWGDLGEVVKREIELMLAKMLIVIPIMHAIGGLMGAMGMNTGMGSIAGAFLSYGGTGFADGGHMNAGDVAWTGERGKELFVADRPGTIVPHGASMAMAGEGGGGVTLNVAYNIQSGMTRNDVMPLLEINNRRLMGELADKIARGGSPARQFGR